MQASSQVKEPVLPGITLALVAAALYFSVFLIFVRKSVWLGPLCLLASLVVIILSLSVSKPKPDPEETFEVRSPGPPRLIFNWCALFTVYILALILFYRKLDTWERWTWLMHSQEDGSFEIRPGSKEARPPLYEIVNNNEFGRWYGPHISHGPLHSKPMLLAFRLFVGKDTTRFSAIQAMRVVNSLFCISLFPLLFFGFRALKIVENVEVPIACALLCPGILETCSKGHWIGISYGLVCLGLFLFMKYLSRPRWFYLLGFLALWALIQQFYTGAVYFFAIAGCALALYAKTVSKTVRYRHLGIAFFGALLVLLLVVGLASPFGIASHFHGNGETLFEIKDNVNELNRFAGYWAESAARYGFGRLESLPLFYRAALGMIDQNVRDFFRNFLGTGSFHPLWTDPSDGKVKTLGFVLPWFLVIGLFLLLFVRRKARGALPVQMFFLVGAAGVNVFLLLFTWYMHPHRIIGINLLFAGMAGILYDRVFSGQRLFKHLEMSQFLFSALFLQALLFLAIVK
jgi:hypothetical protein